MKKFIAIFLAVVMCLSFVACGNSNSDENTKNDSMSDNTNGKGTRNNPYTTNETISYTALYKGENIDVTINVSDKILGKDEISELYRKNYISSDWTETAMVTFTVSCNGIYDSEIYLEKIVEPIFVTAEMKEDAVQGTMNDDSMKSLLNIYTGVEYTVYEGTRNYAPDECKYLRLAYTDVNGNDADIWVELAK